MPLWQRFPLDDSKSCLEARRGRGQVVPIKDYTGRFHPKGIPLSFSGWRYIKGLRFHELKCRKGKGKLSFRYSKSLFKISLLDPSHERGTILCGRYMKVLPLLSSVVNLTIIP